METIRWTILSFLILIFGFSCATGASEEKDSKRIGFNMAGSIPGSPKGDDAAPLHLFAHHFPFPRDGHIQKFIILNDTDEAREEFSFIILRRNEENQWQIVYVQNFKDDEHIETTGETIYSLSESVEVHQGDIFAHWQEGDGGAIPMTVGAKTKGGLSQGIYGLSIDDIVIGTQISNYEFSGERDYYIGVFLE